MQRERDHVVTIRDGLKQRIGGRAGRAALRGEQLDHDGAMGGHISFGRGAIASHRAHQRLGRVAPHSGRRISGWCGNGGRLRGGGGWGRLRKTDAWKRQATDKQAKTDRYRSTDPCAHHETSSKTPAVISSVASCARANQGFARFRCTTVTPIGRFLRAACFMRFSACRGDLCVQWYTKNRASLLNARPAWGKHGRSDTLRTHEGRPSHAHRHRVKTLPRPAAT